MTLPAEANHLEPVPPVPRTFFRGEPHWSNPPDADMAAIEASEARLGIRLPDMLRLLYLEQNGGGSDFVHVARRPDASLTPDDADFDTMWQAVLPDSGLMPVADLVTMTGLQATFDHDPDHAWKDHLPGADRLVRIAQQGWDEYLCLDYSAGRADPAVVLFDDARWHPGTAPAFTAAWRDFDTFFHALRRHVLSTFDGAPYRGIMPAGPHDRPGS